MLLSPTGSGQGGWYTSYNEEDGPHSGPKHQQRRGWKTLAWQSTQLSFLLLQSQGLPLQFPKGEGRIQSLVNKAEER